MVGFTLWGMGLLCTHKVNPLEVARIDNFLKFDSIEAQIEINYFDAFRQKTIKNEEVKKWRSLDAENAEKR